MPKHFIQSLIFILCGIILTSCEQTDFSKRFFDKDDILLDCYNHDRAEIYDELDEKYNNALILWLNSSSDRSSFINTSLWIIGLFGDVLFFFFDDWEILVYLLIVAVVIILCIREIRNARNWFTKLIAEIVAFAMIFIFLPIVLIFASNVCGIIGVLNAIYSFFA